MTNSPSPTMLYWMWQHHIHIRAYTFDRWMAFNDSFGDRHAGIGDTIAHALLNWARQSRVPLWKEAKEILGAPLLLEEHIALREQLQQQVQHYGERNGALFSELAETRAKLNEALKVLRLIAETGGQTLDCPEFGEIKCTGSWCAEQARSWLHHYGDANEMIPFDEFMRGVVARARKAYGIEQDHIGDANEMVNGDHFRDATKMVEGESQ